MSDPLAFIAHARLQFLSEEIEEQLTARAKDGYRVLACLLHMARTEAADALAGLVDVDAAATEDIRRLQNEVRRFADLVAFLKRIVREGEEQVFQVPDEARAELEALIFSPAGEATAEQVAELERLGIARRDDAY